MATGTQKSSAALSAPPGKVQITDEFARKAYQRIVEVRESYLDLISKIESRGSAKQELHEADEKYGKLKRIVDEYNVERVQKDLQDLEEENERLSKALGEMNP